MAAIMLLPTFYIISLCIVCPKFYDLPIDPPYYSVFYRQTRLNFSLVAFQILDPTPEICKIEIVLVSQWN